MIFRVSRSSLLVTSTALLLTVGAAGNLPTLDVARAIAQEQPDGSGGGTYLDEIVKRARDLLAPGSQRDPAAAAELLHRSGQGRQHRGDARIVQALRQGRRRAVRFRSRAPADRGCDRGRRDAPWFVVPGRALCAGGAAKPRHDHGGRSVPARRRSGRPLVDDRARPDPGDRRRRARGFRSWHRRFSSRRSRSRGILAVSPTRPWETCSSRASGDARDVPAAVANFRNASDLGSTSAMFKIAAILRNGDGVPVDGAGARDALLSAIAAGAADRGWFELGTLYASGPPEIRDPANAAAAYERAVELGNPWAMIELAAMLGNGDGVPADFPRAESLLRQAAGLGGDPAPSALVLLGDLYRGPGKNPVEGDRCLSRRGRSRFRRSHAEARRHAARRRGRAGRFRSGPGASPPGDRRRPGSLGLGGARCARRRSQKSRPEHAGGRGRLCQGRGNGRPVVDGDARRDALVRRRHPGRLRAGDRPPHRSRFARWRQRQVGVFDAGQRVPEQPRPLSGSGQGGRGVSPRPRRSGTPPRC